MTTASAQHQTPDVVQLEAVHATALLIGEKGLLIYGPSGSGKSSLALTLIQFARAQDHFARLVGDDRILLSICHGQLVARPHPRMAGQMEQRGRGIVDIEHEAAACIVARTDLVPHDASRDIPPRLPLDSDSTVAIGSIVLPRLLIPTGLSLETSARHVFAFLSGI